MTRLTLGQARRSALAAQGFTDPRPAPGQVGIRHIQRVVDRVGVVQIDSVNVVSRSQYLPFYSRLGAYDTALLDRARDEAPHRLVEYWAHEASLIAPATWPLLTFRMRRAEHESWGGMARVAREHPALVEAVYDEVRLRGPLTSRQVEAALDHDRSGDRPDWGWNWSLVKNALEHLFWAGRITSAGRTTSFERRYAALDVVAPRAGEVRRRWLDPADRRCDDEAFVDLVRMAARALGVGTEQCLRDYFRLRPEQARPAIAHLVATGELVPVEVEGWRRPAYLLSGTRIPRRVGARALLSPFDSLIWTRERTRA
ncbi:MAG TPA: crosslink repair DNA glycosylase YcaQ family protein, partial [Candidatus Lustribacter sp.]|nr:crosslink repair DNA glycosylase YcaQ family protein [Candidatus Lustribacter sp.]